MANVEINYTNNMHNNFKTRRISYVFIFSFNFISSVRITNLLSEWTPTSSEFLVSNNEEKVQNAFACFKLIYILFASDHRWYKERNRKHKWCMF